MSVRTDVINLQVNVNGNDAQNKLNDLRKKANDVKLEMDNLKKGTQEYIDKKTQLAAINQEMADLKKTIGITALTQKELVAELNKLKALKGSVVPFSNEFKELDKQIKAVEGRLYDVRNGVQGFASFFSKIKDEVKQFGMLAAGYLGFEFLTSQFSNIISGAGKLSDQLADIRRVTGMTDAEVKNLNKSLGDLETRTGTSGLREIAIVAGKLGVAKEDILDFVKATDMLVVALGDELGDADQITTQLGKIINVFDKTDGKVTGEKLTHIGNAIVDLANKGVASGGFIVDFTQRLAGLAKTANVGLDEVMGLAAGLEESGQKAESSSTAIIKVIGDIGKDVPKFAKVANMSIEEFSKTLREKPIEAVLKVSEGLAKGKNSFEEIAKSFDTAGEDGARIITTLGVMGGKADFFRQKIADTTLALIDNNEVSDAFALKNMTFGATLDMLSKDFNKLMTSEGVTNFLKSAVEGLRTFINWLKNLPQWLEENRTALIFTSTVILMYVAAKTKATQAAILNRVAILLETAADKLEAAQKVASTFITNAYAVAKGVLTGQTTLATAATMAFNLVLKQNPIMWVIGLLGLLATAISFLTSKVKDLTREQKLQNELKAEMLKQVGEEENKAKALFNALKNSNQTYDAKKKLLDELVKINPEYLKGLTLENIKTQEGADIMKNYILNLRKVGEEKARQSLIDAKLKRKQEIEIEMQNFNTGPGVLDKVKDIGFSVGIGKGSGTTQAFSMLEEINAINKDVDDLMKKSAEVLATDIASKTSNTAKQSVRTIKQIKDEIKGLEDAFVNIDIKDKPGLKSNRDARAKLQAELDALEGKKSKEDKKGESEIEKLKREAKAFEDELKKFRSDVLKFGKSADDKELQDLQEKFEALTAKSLKYYKAHVTSLEHHNKQKASIEELYNIELQKILQRRFEKDAAKEYDDSLKLDADFREQQKIQAAKAYTDGIIDKKQYEEKLNQIELDGINNRVWIANDYSKNVKKAAEDVVQFKKAAEEKTTQHTISEFEKRKAYSEQERLAEAKLKTLTRRGDDKLQAQKDLLQLEFDLKTQGWKKESEQYKLAVQERINAEKDLDKQAQIEKIENIMKYVQYFQDAMSSLNTIISNKENRMLQEEQKRNNAKKTLLKNQLDSKLISEAVYNKKVQQADEELDRKKREIARKQAEREKAMKIFEAVVNTAAGVAKALPNLLLAGIVAAMGALQVGAIASAPLPELADGDWFRIGDKHNAESRGINARIERDEAVMNARTMTDPNVYNLSGTPAQITGALNGMYGKKWASGAVFNDMAWTQKKPVAINPNIPNIIGGGNANNNDAVIEKMDTLIAAFKQFPREIKGKWYTKDFDDAKNLYNATKQAASLTQ